jgi:hypothetical protein
LLAQGLVAHCKSPKSKKSFAQPTNGIGPASVVEAAVIYASPADALRGAVDIIGGQLATARLVGVTQPTVFRWLRQHKALPAEHVLTVESATGIPRYVLRPDIYPHPDAAAPEQPPSLFDRFGGVPAMADELELEVATIIRWQHDRSIPADHQRVVLKTGLRLGIAIAAEDVMFPFPEDRDMN